MFRERTRPIRASRYSYYCFVNTTNGSDVDVFADRCKMLFYWESKRCSDGTIRAQLNILTSYTRLCGVRAICFYTFYLLSERCFLRNRSRQHETHARVYSKDRGCANGFFSPLILRILVRTHETTSRPACRMTRLIARNFGREALNFLWSLYL